MAKVSPNFANFTRGEISPLVSGRVDYQGYFDGATEITNFIVRTQGPVVRRPGTRYVARQKLAHGGGVSTIRIVPFIFSTEQAYNLEFGHNYMRVYRDRGQVLSAGGTVYEIATPYPGVSLAELKWAQKADSIYFTHPDCRQQKLTRTGHASWTMAGVTTEYGPCQDTPYPLQTTLTSTSLGSGNVVPTTLSTDFVRATSVAQAAHLSLDQNRSLVGDYTGICWLTDVGAVSGMRFNIAAGTTGSIDRIYYENCHSSGLLTNQGAYNFSLYGGTSLGAFLNTTWNDNGNLGWEPIAVEKSSFDQHSSSDLVDPKYIKIINCGNYSYFSIKIHDNYGGTRMGMRRVMLQKDERVTINAGTTVFYPGHVGSLWRWDMSGGSSAYFTISQYGSGTSVGATIGHPLTTEVTSYWGEAAWSDYRGWPRCGKFNEDRLLYAGSEHMPTTVWGSATGKYDNFWISENESDGFALTTQNLNSIRWMESVNTLLVGTTGGVLRLNSSLTDAPLTYEAICKTQSSKGCADITPVISGDLVLYVQKANRKIRGLQYTIEKDGYVSTNMNNVAEHITQGGVSGIALQQEPDSILWAYRKDGKFLSFTHSPDEKVFGWSYHTTEGTVEDMAVIPGVEEDELWMVVKRTVGGVDYRYIEYMTPQGFDTQYDCFFVDSGLSTDAPGTESADITGLDHLAGCTVAILVNGRAHRNMVVNALGGVSLDWAGTTKIAGLPYTSTLRTVNLEGGSRMGTVISKTKRVSEVLVRFYNTISGLIGFDNTSLETIKYPIGSVGGTSLYEGDTRMLFKHGFDTEAYVEVAQTSPLPMTILNVIPVFKAEEK